MNPATIVGATSVQSGQSSVKQRASSTIAATCTADAGTSTRRCPSRSLTRASAGLPMPLAITYTPLSTPAKP